MPLLDPVDPPAAADLGAVHFVAIGGVSMSGIAIMYADAGHPVSGSDREDSEVLAQLAARGITVHVGHDAGHLGDADTVVINSAIPDDNPELVAARRRGLRVLHRSVALAALLRDRRGDVIAVSGTHGKTTTSAWVAVALAAMGRDPSYMIGAPLAANGVTPDGVSARIGRGPEFVVEADESDGTFRQYPASIVVITNVAADHLDNWGTREAYAAGFDAFAAGPAVQTVVINLDDPGAAALAGRLTARADGPRVIGYGEHEAAEIRIVDTVLGPDRSAAMLRHRQDATSEGGPIRVRLLGRHNLSNAAAAYAVCRALGIADRPARLAIERFTGTARRFTAVGEVHQVRVFDDYAHNPDKVRAAIAGARAAVGRGRVLVCFQPHLYSRTRDFAAEFADALSDADEVVVTDVYPAREQPIPGVDGALIADRIRTVRGHAAHYVPELADAARATADLARPWDLVMTVGAGSVTRAGAMILDHLGRR